MLPKSMNMQPLPVRKYSHKKALFKKRPWMVGGEEQIYFYGKFDLSEYLEESQTEEKSVLVSQLTKVHML